MKTNREDSLDDAGSSCDSQAKLQALTQQWRYFNDLISQIEG